MTQMADGGLVALALRPEALADDCERAALLVTARQAPPACGALVIDQDRLRRQGALALRRSRDGFAVDAVRPRGVDRPWSPAVAGDAEDGTSLARPATAAAGGRDAVGSRPAGGGLRRRGQSIARLLANVTCRRCRVSFTAGLRIFRQIEGAEMKFVLDVVRRSPS